MKFGRILVLYYNGSERDEFCIVIENTMCSKRISVFDFHS